MASIPLVSVVMPVYNGDAYLEEAIESVLDQTLRDLELIIIDDGSGDNTPNVLKTFNDSRIKLLVREHRGFMASLNEGLVVAKGKYIARMDCDDIARRDRLEKQACFLDAHDDIGIVGSACELINAKGDVIGVRRWPCTDAEIRWASLLTSPFAHPAVMMRRQVLCHNGLKYDSTFRAAEDYDLWTRMLAHTRGANLQEPLVQYRLHDRSMTKTDREVQLKSHDAIVQRTIRHYLPEMVLTPVEIALMREMLVEERREAQPADDRKPMAVAELYLDLLTAFLGRYDEGQDPHDLRGQEALKIARHIIRYGFMPGSAALIRRLLIFSPKMPWLMLGFALRRLRRRLNRNSQPFQTV